MKRLLVTLAIAAIVSPAALAKTPIPKRANGSGNEPTAGGGVMPGGAFMARYSVAVLDVSFDQVEIYLLSKRIACNETFFATPPFVKVTVETQGAQLLIGRPALQNGHAFIQVDFHPAGLNKYFAIQPGASITFTRVDPGHNGMWHGRLTVNRQTFEGHVFSYDGTFSALWCGKD